MTTPDKYLGMFLEEGAEILSKLYEKVLGIEQAPLDAEDVDGVLRLAHTLKGGAKMVGLDRVSRAAHQLESLIRAPHSRTEVVALLALLDEIQGALALVDGSRKPDAEAPHADAEEEPVEGGQAPARAAALGLSDRVRVNVSRLDELQNLVDDLAIRRGRVTGRVDRFLKTLRALERLSGDIEDGLGERARGVFRSLLPHLSAAETTALADDVHELHRMLSELQSQVLDLRMVPLADVLDEYHRIVRGLAGDLGKEVSLTIDGRFTEIDKGLLEAVLGPLRHLVRNAMDHGIEAPEEREAAGKPRCGQLTLRAYHKGAAVVLEVEDDGRGLDAQRIRDRAVRERLISESDAEAMTDEEAFYLLCTPGFTTREHVTEISGRGIGLDAVRSQLERLKGSLGIQSRKGVFSRFRLFLPLSISSLPTLIVRGGGITCAIPSLFVERCLRARAGDLAGGGTSLVIGDRVLPLVSLTRILGEPRDSDQSSPEAPVSVVLLHLRGRMMPLQVDEFVDERLTILKSLGEHVGGVPYVMGVSFLADEQPVPVLNVVDLHPHWTKLEVSCRYRPAIQATRRRVLVVDDSLTTRHMERTILEGLGYDVIQASDGAQAWEILRRESVDAVLTDVEMPVMDGLELTRRVRGHSALSRLPVVMVSNRSEPADLEAGLAAGANAYVPKDRFSQRELEATLFGLVVRPSALPSTERAL